MKQYYQDSDLYTISKTGVLLINDLFKVHISYIIKPIRTMRLSYVLTKFEIKGLWIIVTVFLYFLIFIISEKPVFTQKSTYMLWQPIHYYSFTH